MDASYLDKLLADVGRAIISVQMSPNATDEKERYSCFVTYSLNGRKKQISVKGDTFESLYGKAFKLVKTDIDTNTTV